VRFWESGHVWFQNVLEDIRIKVERALSTRKTEKSLRSMTGLLWGVILSIPIWLILGIVLGFVWK